jgi:tetratricopeptide (TPR) repeat protein
VAALSLLVGERHPIESSHVEMAEALLSRNPGDPATRRLLKDLLWEAARQADERGRSVTARRYLERATDLLPEDPAVWMHLIERHQGDGSWREAERVARRGLSEAPDSSVLHLALARALSRQGRDREAAEALRQRLAARPGDAAARRELALLETNLDSVAGLAHRASSHFNVRFEGEADDALGRALLELLEDKYDMLERALRCEPNRRIPVILLPHQTYSSVSSAPEWAAGYFSLSDARIRIGTRDLSPGFVPLDLERLLTHELAHAFIYACAGSAIPDDINEGLAQYLSGRRLGYRLDPRRAEVREGRMTVDDFYDSALSFVEYLIGRYRQQALSDLLRYAGETGSVDEAFRRALHRTYDETRREWLESLR